MEDRFAADQFIENTGKRGIGGQSGFRLGIHPVIITPGIYRMFPHGKKSRLVKTHLRLLEANCEINLFLLVSDVRDVHLCRGGHRSTAGTET